MIKYIVICMYILFCGCGYIQNAVELNYEKNMYSLDVPNDISTPPEFLTIETKKKQIDILFVLDTYHSMSKHLKLVKKTFKGFIKNISPISWKIAFTNADYNPHMFSSYDRNLFFGNVMSLELNGTILSEKYLYPNSKNHEQIFLDTFKRYESTDTVSAIGNRYINPCNLPPYCQGKVRNPVQSIIEAFSTNKNFLRPSSTAFVGIIFTNGDETNMDKNLIKKYIKFFRKQNTAEKKIVLYSISIIPGDKQCLNKDNNSHYQFSHSIYSNKIYKIVQASGGEVMSICRSNYASLASIIVNKFNDEHTVPSVMSL